MTGWKLTRLSFSCEVASLEALNSAAFWPINCANLHTWTPVSRTSMKLLAVIPIGPVKYIVCIFKSFTSTWITPKCRRHEAKRLRATAWLIPGRSIIAYDHNYVKLGSWSASTRANEKFTNLQAAVFILKPAGNGCIQFQLLGAAQHMGANNKSYRPIQT